MNYPLSSYRISPDSLTLEKWTGSESEIDFNSDVNLIRIQFVRKFAFCNLENLEAIFLPHELTSLETGLFSGCVILKEVALSDKLKKIGEGVFANCYSLEKINLPTAIENIDEYAFSGCQNLRSIEIPKNINCIEKATFKDCSNLKKVLLQEGVTTIKNQAFWDCMSLETITLPYSIVRIEDFAFTGSVFLKNILRPDLITRVENIDIKVDPLLTFLGSVREDSKEWEYMWSKLGIMKRNVKFPDSTVCRNPDNNEVWEYMGTYYEGDMVHNFRHRCHPGENNRVITNIKVSKKFNPEIDCVK